jgi:hypothetical protein
VLSGSSGVVSGEFFFDMSFVLALEGKRRASTQRRGRVGAGKEREGSVIPGNTIFPNLLPRCDSAIATHARSRLARVL